MPLKITYSTDTGIYLPQDGHAAGMIAESYFMTHEDESQITVNSETASWIARNLPGSFNIIKDGNNVIGSTFVFITKEKHMSEFLTGGINERELFQRVREEYPFRPETVYICSAVVLPEYRRMGLALSALVKSVEKIVELYQFTPVLFYWAYSPEGQRLAEKLGDTMKLQVLKRK